MIRIYSNGLRLLIILALLAAPGGAPAALAAPTAASGLPFSLEGAFFTHLSTALNTSGVSSGFYNPLANINPSAVVLATQNWTAPGTTGILNYDPHPTGLAYNPIFLGSSYWSVINEDAATMPVGIGFNVAVITNTSRAFTVIANTGGGGNTGGNVTTIHNPLTDGHPEVMPMISQVYNPGGGLTGIFNPHSVGVYYTGLNWAIFNEDRSAISNGVAFKVYVPTGNVFMVSSTSANTPLGYNLTINNPLLNYRPDALAFVTQVWASTGVYNDPEPGIWYTGNHKWAISNADNTQLPLNASFFVWVPSDQDVALIQRSALANIIASQTRLDDPRLNNDPNLLLLATPNFNPGGSAGVADNSPISVSYNVDGHYRINNENGSNMPLGAAFNDYSPGITPRSLVQKVNVGFIPSGDTRFSNPFLDNNPSAYLFITANDTPFGSPGVIDNHPTSVFYDTAFGYWSIVNTDGTAMPVAMAFNLFIPPDSMAPFTIVSSLSNMTGSAVYINNPRTNHHPEVALLVTQVKTAVPGSHNIGVKYDLVLAEWGIMNEDSATMAAGMEFYVLVLTPDTVYLPLIKH